MSRTGTAADLASLVRERGPAVVLTGAGMSTESGIPDFRSAQGMWAEVDPMEVASIEGFRRDPVRVWQWYGPRIHRLLAAEPNPGHRALADLERAGYVQAVEPPDRAVHLDEREAPVCPLCSAILKPGVVMFGELLPVDAFLRAERLAQEAGVLVAVGSSLQVWPVAGLPAATLRAGGALAIVNDEPTGYDDNAAVIVRGRAAEALAGATRILTDEAFADGADAAS